MSDTIFLKFVAFFKIVLVKFNSQKKNMLKSHRRLKIEKIAASHKKPKMSIVVELF